MKSSDVVVACVAEDRPEWYRMVENLAISTRNFGGRLAGARFVAYFVEGFDRQSARLLLELGVELRVARRYDPAHPTTNKLRMFQDFAERRDAYHLIALDCDTVVVGDFLDELLPDAVRAMPAMRSHLTSEQWRQLLDSLGLPAARSPMVTTRTHEAMPAPYVNSGVIFVPAEHAVSLAVGWTKYVDEFVGQTEAGIDEPWTGNFLDQVALACALLDQQIPLRELGPGMNMTTAARLKVQVPESIAAVGVLHYHQRMSDTGLVPGTDSPALNSIIDNVNAVLAARAPRDPLPTNRVKKAPRVMRRMKGVIRS